MITALDVLDHVDTENSYILRIVAVPARLDIECDFALTPEHPQYAEPRPGEAYCYRRGTLSFLRVADLKWSDQGKPPAIDANGEIDYGEFDEVTLVPDGIVVTGDFGRIVVRADDVRLEYDESAP